MLFDKSAPPDKKYPTTKIQQIQRMKNRATDQTFFSRLEEAKTTVDNGEMSQRLTARTFSVNRRTIQKHRKGKVGKKGRPPLMTSEERAICQRIFEQHIPLSREVIIDRSFPIVDESRLTASWSSCIKRVLVFIFGEEPNSCEKSS